MDKVSMRQIFMTIVISVMACTCTVGATNHNHSQNPDIRKFSKTILVEKRKVRFTICADFEYPANYPELQTLLARELFRNDSATDLETAFEKYMEAFLKITELKKTNTKSNGYIKFTTRVFGKHEIDPLLSRVSMPDSFNLQADRYMAIYCDVYKMANSQMREAGIILPKSIKYMATYDKEEHRLLNVTDVFTQEAMEKLDIDNSTENTAIMVRPYLNEVAFITKKKRSYQVTISKNISSFTERIRIMAPYIEKEKKKIEEAELEKREEERKMRNKTTYQHQNTDMKNLYLYLLYDTCYVSGIHKNIMTLTDEEIDRLAKTSKCGYIKQEILEAKKYMTASPEPGFITIDKDPENSYRMNGDAYPSAHCILPVPEKTMIQLAKKGKTYNGREKSSKWEAIYIVDSTGCVIMPITIVDMEDPENSSIPKMDRLYVAKLRKMKHSKPAMKDGHPVRSIVHSGLTRLLLPHWLTIP